MWQFIPLYWDSRLHYCDISLYEVKTDILLEEQTPFVIMWHKLHPCYCDI